MADPLSIVGAVAAVIDLTKLAYKIVNIAHNSYTMNSETGVHKDEKLQDVTLSMHNALHELEAQQQGMSKKLSPLDKDKDDSLAPLIALSREIGQEILELLVQSKTAGKSSLRASIRAAAKRVWNQEKLDKLKEDLRHHMIQIGVQVQIIARSETGETLNLILEANQSGRRELSSHKALLESIKKGQQVAAESLGQLRDIFVLPDEARQAVNRQRILGALEFPEMNSRFKTIYETSVSFKWCIYNDNIPKSHPELKISFQEWLKRGQGVFHISGKLGSGKSTLMKFIAQHGETDCLLRQWAGSRELITASFFCWKPGTALQKSLEGLLRSLVHCILSKLPHLIPVAFPRHWQPAGPYVFWMAQQKPEITEADILYSFEYLTQRPCDDKEKYAFCFFVDGLDEFDDPNPTGKHTLLALQLKSWAQTNPNNVKICVSSREENPFMDNFSPDQRLRLHLLTENDMTNTVSSRLGMHPRFQLWSDDDRQTLIKKVVGRAQGVFLWVTFVLNDLWEALDQKQAPSYLMGRLNILPGDLDEFFRRIVDSISKPDRKEAWAILAMVAATEHLHIVERPNLLNYSFIKDLVNKPNMWTDSHTMNTLRDFGMAHQVSSFKSRVKALCRGLVEVEPVWKSLPSNEEGLSFAHRSLSEYFKFSNLPERSELKDFFAAFDAQATAIQCLIVELEQSPARTLNTSDNTLMALGMRLCGLLFWIQQSTPNSHLKQLGFLEDVLLRWQHGFRSVLEPDWSVYHCFGIPDFTETPLNKSFISVLAFCCWMGFRDFVEWSVSKIPERTASGRTRSELLITITRDYSGSEDRYYTLRYMLQQGFGVNQRAGGVFSPWESFLLAMTRETLVWEHIHQVFWPVVHLMLQYDANPDCFFHVEPNGDTWVEACNTRWKNPMPHSSIWICRLIGKRGGKASLRDLVEEGQPNNMEEILRLIDRNMASREPPAHYNLSTHDKDGQTTTPNTPQKQLDESRRLAEDPDKPTHKVELIQNSWHFWMKLFLSILPGALIAAILARLRDRT